MLCYHGNNDLRISKIILLNPTLGLLLLQFQHHCLLLSEFPVYSQKYEISVTPYDGHI